MEDIIQNKDGVPQEEWRPIVEYEGLYEVSNLGHVRSYVPHTLRLKGAPIQLKPIIVAGYACVNLYKRVDGKRVQKMFKIHRLVAQAFIPNPDNKPCIDHINTDKLDNSVDNLKWCDHKENNNNPITVQRNREKTLRLWQDDGYRSHVIAGLHSDHAQALFRAQVPVNRRPVICVSDNNREFDSIKAAADFYHLAPGSVTYQCNRCGTSNKQDIMRGRPVLRFKWKQPGD